MGKLVGLGVIVFGLAGYFDAIPWPMVCRSTTCEIGTALIPVPFVIMGVGALLIVLGFLFSRKS